MVRRPIFHSVGVLLGLVACVASADGARPRMAGVPRDLLEGNLMVNPGFEGTFEMHGAPELGVGTGWTPWFDERQTRPEYKGEAYEQVRADGSIVAMSQRVFHGAAVQKMFTSSSTHDAGFYQQVRVAPGARLRFGAWVRTWSSDCNDPCVSPLAPCRAGSDNSHGSYRTMVGIDPTGAVPSRLGEVPPATVRWSPDAVFEPYLDWSPLVIETAATGEWVTVYLRGNPQWPVKHNDSYWDDARLEDVTGPPTRTPAATAAPTEGRATTTATAAVPVTPSPATPVVFTHHSALPLLLAHGRGGGGRDATTAPGSTPVAPTTAPAPTGADPSATATVPPEPYPSPTALARCVSPVVNGSFEDGNLPGWAVGPAARARPIVVAEPAPQAGEFALRLGLSAPLEDLGPSWSWAAQAVTLPADIVTATLSFVVRPASHDTGTGDWQQVALRDASGAPLELLYWKASGRAEEWTRVETALDVTEVAGRTISVMGEVFNDGDGAPSALYLDAVGITACRGPAAAPADDPVPPSADIRITFPIRYHPAQSSFALPATCDEIAFESLIVRNQGAVPVEVAGWTLRNRAGDAFVFPPISLEPGERIRVWTRAGDDVTDGAFSDVYWGRRSPVWGNDGDEAVIVDDNGTEVARRGYP
jgi:hypothetical protein